MPKKEKFLFVLPQEFRHQHKYHFVGTTGSWVYHFECKICQKWVMVSIDAFWGDPPHNRRQDGNAE